MLLIDETGKSLGVKKTSEAIQATFDKGYDLVEIGPNSSPAVCRMLDFGKYMYELEKKQQKSKAKSHFGEVKEIRFTPQTGEHDLNTKIERIKKFISEGYKIRLTVKMKGRENIYSQRALEQIKKIKENAQLKLEQEPVRLGNRFTCILVADKESYAKDKDKKID